MFKCEPCNKEFQSKEALSQHNRDKHDAAENRQQKEEKREETKNRDAFSSSFQIKKIKRVAKYGIALLAVTALLYLVIVSLSSSSPSLREGLGTVGSQHVHADFKVYLNGNAVDFSQPKYQLKAQHVHVEGGDGDVVHLHATGVKIGYFFSTVGMKFNSTCFVLDEGGSYCNSDGKTLKFYVNDVPNDEWQSYVMKSMDRILVSYGNEDITDQLSSITSKSEGLDTGKVPLPMR